jgi:hypothetical protein
MRVAGLANVFAAGDVASSLVDGVHSTVMSLASGEIIPAQTVVSAPGVELIITPCY